MAKLSILANRISEVQEKNLKHYPFVFFNEIRSIKIDYDLARKENSVEEQGSNHRVTYYLELDELSNNMHLEKRLLCIESAVRVLFWKDILVEVFFNGKKIYPSVKNV